MNSITEVYLPHGEGQPEIFCPITGALIASGANPTKTSKFAVMVAYYNEEYFIYQSDDFKELLNQNLRMPEQSFEDYIEDIVYSKLEGSVLAYKFISNIPYIGEEQVLAVFSFDNYDFGELYL